MAGFGPALKELRKRRRFSQMRLALTAGVSARHISFLETGKAAPSREMVLKLCRALSASPETLNTCLSAAGYKVAFSSRSLTSSELQPFLTAADRLLTGHEPNPAWLVDGDWRIIRANRCGRSILALLGLGVGDALVDAVIDDPTLGGVVVNWRESAAHLYQRLSAEARRRECDQTSSLAGRLSGWLSEGEAAATSSPATSTILRINGRIARFVSLLCHFNTANDLTLASLRAELFCPLDPQSEAIISDLEAVATNGETIR